MRTQLDLVSSSDEVPIRRVSLVEADDAARVLIAARHAAVPAIPPPVHTDDETLAWFRDHVMATNDVWAACVESSILAVMVLSEGWIEQLHVSPDNTNQGLGSALIDHAKSEATGSLDLWTFASNVGAQRFYQRHGFVEVDRTAGDNEEGQPDIRYRWSAS